MSVYREFTGRSVEEALRTAREEFGVGLDELDFEILSSGSRGVLGMGAEPARIVAAPRSMLGGAAPKRDAAAAAPLPPRPQREEWGRGGDRDRGPRPAWRDDHGGRGGDRGPDRAGDRGHRPGGAPGPRPAGQPGGQRPGRPAGGRDRDFGRSGGHQRPPRREEQPRTPPALTAKEVEELAQARIAGPAPRAESAEVTPEAMAAAKEILEQLMAHLGFDVRVEVQAGETNRLNVVGDSDEKDSLGALIGRKGERLSALQHLLNLLLSKRVGTWTRVLVDVEDYRGRRERQLRDLATRAAQRVQETGKMLQLEPMPALERRWIHLALREHPDVATQSVGEEPNRRVVVLPRHL